MNKVNIAQGMKYDYRMEGARPDHNDADTLIAIKDFCRAKGVYLVSDDFGRIAIRQVDSNKLIAITTVL